MGRKKREHENESLNSLLAQGNVVLDLFHFDDDEAHGERRPVSEPVGLGKGFSISTWLHLHVYNLLLTISSVPGSTRPSRGSVPGAKMGVHLSRSDGTFYLLTSFLKSGMNQPGSRQKKKFFLTLETVNYRTTQTTGRTSLFI